jgi:hypothetical protein
MRTLLKGLALVALAVPAMAMAGSWDNVPIVDQMCVGKVRADPDKHPTSCLLKCAGSGYGILTTDGKYLTLDKAGNEKAVAALKETKKQDHVRVNVTGEQKGETIEVSSIAVAK